MNFKKFYVAAGLSTCMGVALGILTSCVGYVETSRVGYTTYEDDDYVYYPEYDVYYSQRRHDYIYLEGGSWRRRSTPAHVSVDVLYSSPSYHMTFHDSPQHHHDDVRRKYSRHDHDNGNDRDDDKGRGHDDEDHGKGHNKHKDKD